MIFSLFLFFIIFYASRSRNYGKLKNVLFMSSSQAASQVNRVSLILRCGFWVHIWNTYVFIYIDVYIHMYMEIIIVLYELLMHL